MYLHASIGIDPSQLTRLQRVEPSSTFGRLLYVLSAGLLGERREIETFTAVSILQQLDSSLRRVGVTNSVRLAIDGDDLYVDEAGRADDLDEAIHAVERRARMSDDGELALFERVLLVLEHEIEQLTLLIRVEIDRAHAEAEYPIHVRVDGLLSALRSPPSEAPEALRARMRPWFDDAEAYETRLDQARAQFAAFVSELESAIGEDIPLDDSETRIELRLIRPAGRVRSREQMRAHFGPEHDDLLFGYRGFDDALFYTWLWSGLSYEADVPVRDLTIFDEDGNPVVDVGAEGFSAKSAPTLDPDAPFAVPADADVEVHGDNRYAVDLDKSGAVPLLDDGWLSRVFDDVGDPDGDPPSSG